MRVTPTQHGADGWRLEDMDWSPETGVATFTYSHRKLGERVVTRPQPSSPTHEGWQSRDTN